MPTHDEEQTKHSSDFGSNAIVFGAMMEAGLLAIYGAAHPTFLPLAGGHFEQGGVIFLTIVAVDGFHHLYRQGVFKPVVSGTVALVGFAQRKYAEVNLAASSASRLLRGVAKAAATAAVDFVMRMAQKSAEMVSPPHSVAMQLPVPRVTRPPRQHRRIVVIIGVPVLKGMNRALDFAVVARLNVRRLLRELELSAFLLAYEPVRTN